MSEDGEDTDDLALSTGGLLHFGSFLEGDAPGVGWDCAAEALLRDFPSEPPELEGGGGDGNLEGVERLSLGPLLGHETGCGWKGMGPPHCSPNGFPYMGNPSIFRGGWKGRYGASPFFPMMRLRDGIFWRPGGTFLLLADVLALPGLSMTFRLRIIRLLFTSRGLTLRLTMRTVSEKGETCMRDGKPPALGKVDAIGSERGSGRLDMR